MARINVEERWWGDHRRAALILILKDDLWADALAIRFWKLAQTFWKSDRSGIPRQAFDLEPRFDAFLKVGLALEKDGFVYAKGSKKSFDWLVKRTKDAKNAGKASGTKRRRKINNLTERECNETERDVNETATRMNPLTLTPTLTPTLTQNTKIQNTNTSYCETKVSQPTKNLIYEYIKIWEQRYAARNALSGKDKGLLKGLQKELGFPRALELLIGFFEMPDAWNVKQRHSVVRFNSCLQEVAHFVDQGITVSMAQVREKDRELERNVSANKEAQEFLAKMQQQDRTKQLEGES